ncbi:hypothetical protein PUNSTDRAFT_137359 [Punctularia strigosozonata HHB-11173 SS5]|uniref:uncharacterized protein n=1 Tax=Punctularia strigosozonata (strain HHB-11173) TaxID=741275 RepID=UPI00044164EF|nr:uncharacterized protein PUNSTDRAFT_137359 [Punctularia strigosozonata HHB-11173 SS5]EIN05872.1 hypothetical protein PUNSTDRAFT_137359 [Punctularia strigosozonata HHB-11173 SS5]
MASTLNRVRHDVQAPDYPNNSANLGQHQHHQSLHELSTSTYNDGYRPSTHNIFNISGPLTHNLHLTNSATSSGAPFSNLHAFSLLQTIHRPPDLGCASSLGTRHHHHPSSLHDFSTLAHFNSTLPMLNSSMRFDPHPPQPHKQQPSSLVSSSSHIPSSTSVPSDSDFHSRSRAPSSSPGPTRMQSTSCAKRNSMSSSSPLPHPQPGPIIVPPAPPPPRLSILLLDSVVV